MLLLTKIDRETDEPTYVLINHKRITSAVYVPSSNLTAVNMDTGPSIWVEDTPEEIYQYIKGEDRG